MKRFAYLLRFLPILFFVGLTITFFYFSPEGILSLVGVENAYVLLFVLAFLGGLTTGSGIPYHVVLISFAAGGLNPLILGITTALAVTFGDCTTYYVGYFGGQLMPVRVQTALKKLSFLKERYPRLLPTIFFLYGACVPFSSDLVTIPMGFLKYPLWRVMLPLGLGTVIFNTALAYAAVYLYGWLAPFT
ncbi:hypothetical protein A3F55_02855 [Candidatus Adlerbacteria bacterium RIFCSPHIGHO2_12_FULL_53_18]|uniref:DedA family protein n=1 Tax=Candidatus Adlerbacteria bacterium RIFCSPHIGHO2_12_FULL_53_18 TaxID=1797242 RepID=A0A1F4XTJ7_9BACT|nr:MAG: hypothetical protein A3F55_02855 [Candidatus Adlerbacteria bacterium RIFCSPHIGHO2_12_FULL_53_18]